MKTLVTGDFILDTHILKGNRIHSSSSTEDLGTHILTLYGGAHLTFELLKGIFNAEKESIKLMITEKSEEIKKEEDKKKKDCLVEAQKKLSEKLKEHLSTKLETELQNNLIKNKFKKFTVKHHNYNSYIEWDWNKSKERWMNKILGYGKRLGEDSDISTILHNTYENYETIIIDEANLGFRNPDLKIENKKVFIKMTYPFCEGKLWNNLKSGNNELYSIVTLENLRRYHVKVSKAISWEQTALDLCFEVTQNEMLKELLKSTYIIIVIGSAGALCIKPDKIIDNTSFELILDPLFMEDEWEQINGNSIGSGSTFTASFSLNYIKAFTISKNKGKEYVPNIHDLISTGLNHVRILNKAGLIITPIKGESSLHPFKQLACAGKDKPYYYSSAFVPSPFIQNKLISSQTITKTEIEKKISYLKNSEWNILENNYFTDNTDKKPEPYFSLARDIAYNGPCMAQYAPQIQFGKFISLDRSEIESLRNIKQLVLDYYENHKANNPLNLAIFGAPGAGKSFAVKQLASSILHEDKILFLEYNLSQFNDPSQLAGAFHSVRDAVLRGKLPFVFWDEFDSKDLSWLKELIAPMQDGKFLEHGILHPLGKCIFIFAGGTSYKMEAFDPEYYSLTGKELQTLKTDNEKTRVKEKQELLLKEFKMKKGPDFLSRINGFLNVQGPNPNLKYDRTKQTWVKDDLDVCYPVRRALFLRGVLDLKDGVELKMDWGLVSAFLELSNYIRGSRSMERLIGQITLKNKDALIRSNLPSDEIIGMNVDFANFMEKMYKDRHMEELSEKMAIHIHNTWMDFKVKGSSFNNEYKKLNYNGRKDNIAAAARIFEILKNTAVFEIKPRTIEFGDASEKFKQHIENVEKLELLAEREHNGWMDERKKDGWKTDPELKENRNDYLRFHPCIRLYKDLDDSEKEKDRKTIRMYTNFLKDSGFMIIELKK